MRRSRRMLLFGGGGSYPSQYDLYDAYVTPLPAGSVHGTQAEPVGGVRTVTDTAGTKLSIANNALTFAASGAGTGDPGVRYTSLARVLGKTVLGRLVVPEAVRADIGWDGDTTLTVTDSLAFAATTSLFVRANAIAVAVGAYGAATYDCAVVMRTAGTFCFIRGGAFTKWTLLWSHLAGTSAGRPAVVVSNNANLAFTADNIRVPKRLYIPTPLQCDGFSAATTDGAGNAEANGPAGTAWTGATWTVSGGAVTNAPTQGAEKISNGGFDSAATDWTAVRSALASVAGGQAGNCLEVTLVSGTDQGAYQALATSAAEQWWLLSAYVKSGSSGNEGYKVWAQRDSGDYGSAKEVLGTSSASWTQVLLALRTTTAIRIRADKTSGTAGTMLFDTASAKQLTLSTLFRSLTASSANVIADVAITRTAHTQAGLVLNLDSAASPANFVIAYLDGAGNCNLDKCIAGVYTNVIMGAVTYSAGAVLRVVVDGTSYRLFYNNLAVGSVGTVAGLTANALHGLFSTYSGNSFDNFCLWARGNEGQYSELDSM